MASLAIALMPALVAGVRKIPDARLVFRSIDKEESVPLLSDGSRSYAIMRGNQ
jgi:hypothetical protein